MDPITSTSPPSRLWSWKAQHWRTNIFSVGTQRKNCFNIRKRIRCGRTEDYCQMVTIVSAMACGKNAMPTDNNTDKVAKIWRSCFQWYNDLSTPGISTMTPLKDHHDHFTPGSLINNRLYLGSSDCVVSIKRKYHLLYNHLNHDALNALRREHQMVY